MAPSFVLFWPHSFVQGGGDCLSSAFVPLPPIRERTLKEREQHALRIFWRRMSLSSRTQCSSMACVQAEGKRGAKI